MAETATDLPMPTVATRRELFRRFLKERDDPETFYSRLAARSMAEFEFPLTGRRVLDLGSGVGHYSVAMDQAGAEVIAADLRESNVECSRARGVRVVRADALALPFRDASFDGVFCSNLLEHVPDPVRVLSEIERVLRPSGWAWVSWTNWYSPWGGHLITPFHYLGPRLGSRVHHLVKGPPERNPVFAGLWPTHVGQMLRAVRGITGLRLHAAVPRYYKSQRWIVKVPLARELLTWNCLLLLERVDGRSAQ